MARKSVKVDLPANVVVALDARAKALGFSRAKLLEDLLVGASGLMDEMTSTKVNASVPVTIGFRPQAILDFGRAAKILRTTPSVLISRSLEIGQESCVATAREFEREQSLLEDTKIH